MRKVESFEFEHPSLGTVAYKITALDAINGRRVFLKLIKLLGPLAQAKGSLGEALKGLEEKDLDDLCDAFAKVTTITYTDTSSGKTVQEAKLGPTFGEHFSAAYMTMFSWLKASAEVNFGDFLAKALAAKDEPAAEQAKKP